MRDPRNATVTAATPHLSEFHVSQHEAALLARQLASGEIFRLFEREVFWRGVSVVHHKLHEDLYVRSQQPMFVTLVRCTKMACMKQLLH